MLETRPTHFGTLHFIGIGGIGMSGIAEALNALGYDVQGSDQSEGYNTKRLERHNIPVFIGHDAQNLKTPAGGMVAAVIISSAIKSDNPELLAARTLKLPIIRRADMLAELMRQKKSIAIAGTHGKTTTTSLVGAMLEGGGFDPTIINGGIIHAYGTNTRMGAGDWIVVESDESDGSFNRLPVTIAVITNIDPEHMEHYGSFDAVRAAYRNFIEHIPFYGFAVVCADHPETRQLIDTITDRRIISYGFDAGADARAVNVQMSPDGATFDVQFASRLTGTSTETITGIQLPMMGQHNVQNALATLAIARAFDIQPDIMHKALAEFQGVKRRFTKTGVANGITVIDDYGHHPVEIRATLAAARQAVAETKGRVIAVVQPHRYSRLSSLFPEFTTAFTDADCVIVADVYAAGEQPIPGFDRDALVTGIKGKGQDNVFALQTPDDLARLVADIARPNDFVICLGAGSITAWAHHLPDELTTLFAPTRAANG